MRRLRIQRTRIRGAEKTAGPTTEKVIRRLTQ
jgi:hypothetical protein